MSTRKPYNDRAGYIASRRNDLNRGWVVIYNAAEAGLDDSDGKYAVVCETHGAILNTTSLPKARPCLKYPDFCSDCMATGPEAVHRGHAAAVTQRGNAAIRAKIACDECGAPCELDNKICAACNAEWATEAEDDDRREMI